MTDTELRDAAAIKVMGWHIKDGRWFDIKEWFQNMVSEEIEGLPYEPFDPLTRWDHAGLLWEEMVKKGWGMAVGYAQGEDGVLRWGAIVENDRFEIKQPGETGPDAITRAAVAAVAAVQKGEG
jgi:hypothetical protein